MSELCAEVLGTKSDKMSTKVLAKLLPIYNHCAIVPNSTLKEKCWVKKMILEKTEVLFTMESSLYL
jgi:hypothetical protein